MMIGRFGGASRQFETLMRVGSLGNVSDGQLLDRFLERREGGEAAFESLVARHGGMVRVVCRNVLGSAEEADDAFQATFLVLVRQAASIRKKDSLGPWLHGVARRVSLRARRDAARRHARERTGFRVVGSPLPDESLAEALHEEIARLPEKYRSPIVLCDLEGHSHAEAARSLDWPIGTVSGRLSRARALLRSRFARRGLALSVAALATALRGSEARAAVGPLLVGKTTACAASHLAGHPIAPGVSALAAEPLRSASTALVSVAAGLIAVAGLGAWTLDVARQRDATPPAAARTPSVAMRPPVSIEAAPLRVQDDDEIVAVALAPDGLTLASGSRGARVTIWDLKTGLEKATLLGHSAAVRSLAFTSDGRLLASASEDHTIKVWDLASGLEALTVTWLGPADGLAPDSIDSAQNAAGRDRPAGGSVRRADGSGA